MESAQTVQHDFFSPADGDATLALPDKYFPFQKRDVFVAELGHLFCKNGKCFVVIVGVEKRVAFGERDVSKETLLFVINDGKLEKKRISAFKDAAEVAQRIENIIL